MVRRRLKRLEPERPNAACVEGLLADNPKRALMMELATRGMTWARMPSQRSLRRPQRGSTGGGKVCLGGAAVNMRGLGFECDSSYQDLAGNVGAAMVFTCLCLRYGMNVK